MSVSRSGDEAARVVLPESCLATTALLSLESLIVDVEQHGASSSSPRCGIRTVTFLDADAELARWQRDRDSSALAARSDCPARRHCAGCRHPLFGLVDHFRASANRLEEAYVGR